MGHWQLSLCHHNGHLAASRCTCSASVQGTTLSRCHHRCQLGCASRMCYSQVLQTIAASLKGRGGKVGGEGCVPCQYYFPCGQWPSFPLPFLGLTCMEFSFAWIVQVFFFAQHRCLSCYLKGWGDGEVKFYPIPCWPSTVHMHSLDPQSLPYPLQLNSSPSHSCFVHQPCFQYPWLHLLCGVRVPSGQ